MKFEFDAAKCVDMGLEVKYGNVGNVVFFYDQIEAAAGYKLELFRLNLDMKQNGFLQPADIKTEKCRYGENRYVEAPSYMDNELVGIREWKEGGGYGYPGVTRKDIERCCFGEVKPICTVEMERNVFYASVSFLPEGNYICMLKAEDRTGNEIAASMP